MAGNIRNQRTTHPRKAARRERAAQRFQIDPVRASMDKVYRERKMVEQQALSAWL